MKKLILASNSPRRKELLAGLGIPFEVKVLPDIDESCPASIPAEQQAQYIAQHKAAAYIVQPDEFLITADTTVVIDNQILGKPVDSADAQRILQLLSGREHQVITGVCLRTYNTESLFSVATKVTFKKLTDAEIQYYVDHYKPFDKAGAYGIQEWIGFIGVTQIHGSYYNVMGLPIQRIYSDELFAQSMLQTTE